MCLYPKLINNPKYRKTIKNGGIIPECKDERIKLIPVGCGKCIECRNQKKRNWQIRLHEELKNDNTGIFVTLTFSCEELEILTNETKLDECNAVATIAVRRFLERWRKEHKKSVKHWLITELGHQNTERIHLHGIIFTTNVKDIVKHWKYGNVTIGNKPYEAKQWKNASNENSFVNAKTVNYIVKYMTKIDNDHKGFEGIVLCSPGIGKNYLKREKVNQYNEEKTIETYRLNNGAKIPLPIYYRNKLYTEEEREKLWINKINKGKYYINGIEFNLKNEKDWLIMDNIRKKQQQINKILGYGDDSIEFRKKNYNITLRMLNKKKKIQELKDKSNENIYLSSMQRKFNNNEKF